MFFVVNYNLECQEGFYKSTVSNTKCVECPANSDSNTERTGCTLITDAPCKGKSIHNLHARG